MARSFNQSRRNQGEDPTSSKQLLVVEPEDRLSFLPQELQVQILSYLPLLEAAKSSVLSKLWKRMWEWHPHLIFNYGHYPNGERKRERFLQFINDTLTRHAEADIKTFELYLWPHFDTYINVEWVTFAVNHNVEKVLLCGKVEDQQKLPNCLFTSSSLVTLELEVGNLFLEWSKEITLPNVTKLSLQNIRLSQENHELDLSSSCPSLESFSISLCGLMDVKVFTLSSTRIRNITMSSCQGIDECEIKLQTPGLEMFSYLCDVARDYHLTDMSALSFASVIFGKPYPTERRDHFSQCASKVSRALRSAERLVFNPNFIQFLSKSKICDISHVNVISFVKVEKMRLFLWPTQEQFQTAFRLLSRCPRLSCIDIVITRSEQWAEDIPIHDFEFANLDYLLRLDQLRFVSIQDFEGNANEIQLVRLILEYAEELCQMEIMLTCGVDRRCLKMSKILRFRRALDANISFTKVTSASHTILTLRWEHKKNHSLRRHTYHQAIPRRQAMPRR